MDVLKLNLKLTTFSILIFSSIQIIWAGGTTSIARPRDSRTQTRSSVNACFEILRRAQANASSWEVLSSSFERFKNEAFGDSPESLSKMSDLASEDLRNYYDSIGLHFNWTRDVHEKHFTFADFAHTGVLIEGLRAQAAKELGVPLDRIMKAQMIFQEISNSQNEIPVSLGAKIPDIYRASHAQLLSGRNWYRYLANRIFIITAPMNHSILSESKIQLITTEHEFAHFYGPLVVRPEMNDALAEVGQTIVELQNIFDTLSIMADLHPMLFDIEARHKITLIQSDVAANLMGIDNLWQRLFFNLESAYFVPKNLDFTVLPKSVRRFSNLENLKSSLEKLSKTEWAELLTTLKTRLPEWAIPVGGASADLRYFFHHADSLPKPNSKVERDFYDHGLINLLGRVYYYIDHPHTDASHRAEDIAKLLIHLKMAQGMGPEDWIRETVVKPVQKQIASLQSEIRRLQSSKDDNKNYHPQFNPEALELPMVDPQSNIAKFIFRASWFDAEKIRKTFGFLH
jgi:hypothetical protein